MLKMQPVMQATLKEVMEIEPAWGGGGGGE